MDFGEILGEVLDVLRGELGSFGELVFQVSSQTLLDVVFGKQTAAKLGNYGINGQNFGEWIGTPKILTFKNFERRTKARLATHELINQPAMIEHIGTDVEKITMDILLMTALGVDVAAETEKIHDYLTDGYVDFLIIGSEIVGDCQWVISNLREKKTIVDGYGRTTVAELAVEFTSYAEPVE
ncbi:MAG: phage tail protein [Selenomonadaceae bacterium]|nr:phage tail protein [Selenomonadaceae bacterium]